MSKKIPTKLVMACALECQIRFLFEKRTEPYKGYGERASQEKIGFGAKNNLQARALLELERCGA